jgi:hypothetical protein
MVIMPIIMSFSPEQIKLPSISRVIAQLSNIDETYISAWNNKKNLYSKILKMVQLN